MTHMTVPSWPQERVKARRALKEAVFALIYGAFVPPEKREAAETAIRNFDEESARLYPDIAAERAKAQAYNRWDMSVEGARDMHLLLGIEHPLSGDHRPR